MLFKDDERARAEAKAVRENAGWYRWTHDLVELTGPDAEEFLDWVMVNRIAGTPPARGKYTTMLAEDGTIIDDLVAFRRGDGTWWLSTLYGPHMVRWFDAHRERPDGGEWNVSYEDVTPAWDMYAVQGPESGAVMAALGVDVAGMKRFEVREAQVADVPVVVDRGGFTGELGYEVYCRREDSPAVEAAIAAACEGIGAPKLRTLEVYVRSLPMEKGMGLRQDYYGLTPYEAGLGWSVRNDKDFIGREALAATHAAGEQRALLGVEIERDSYEDIAQNELVYKRGVPVGKVRQMIYGYTVDKNIGLAILDAEKCPVGTRVTIGCNDSPATVVEPRWC